MASGVEIGRANIVVTPVLRGLQATVERQLGNVGAKAGKQTGERFAKGIVDGLEDARIAERKYQAEVKRTAQVAEKARESEATASRKVRIEEERLNEQRSSGRAKTSQLLAAEDRLERAKNTHRVASRRLATSVAAEAQALDRSRAALNGVRGGLQDTSDEVGTTERRFAGLPSAIRRAASTAGNTLGRFATTVGGAGLRAGKAFGSKLLTAIKTAASAAGRAVTTSLRAAANGARRIISGLGTALRTTLIAASAAAVAGIGYTLKTGFDRFTGIENAQAALTGLGHTAKSVEKIMDNALAAVKGTAFGLDEAAKVAASTVAAGVKPGKDLEGILKLVADAATIGGISMEEMGAIFNKVAASNKLDAEIFNQLGDRGIPILQFLADSMGKTTEEVLAMRKAGELNFEHFRKAMEEGLGGAAAASGKTFTGSMANVNAAIGRLGASFLGGVFPQIRDFMNEDLIPAIDNLGPHAEKAGEKVGKAFQWIVDRGREALPKIKGVVEAIRGAFERAGAGLSVITSGKFTKQTEKALGADKDSPIGRFLLGIHDALESADFGGFLDKLKDFGKRVGPILLDVARVIAGVLGQLAGAFNEIREAVVESVAQLIEKHGPKVEQFFKDVQPGLEALLDGLTNFGKSALPVLKDIVDQIFTTLEENGPEISDILSNIGGLFTALGVILEASGPALSSVVGSVLDLVIGLADGLLKIISGIFGTIQGLIEGDPEMVKKSMDKILGGMADWFKENQDFTREIMIGIGARVFGIDYEKFSEADKATRKAFSDLVYGIKDAIGPAFESIIDTAGGWWDQLVQDGASAFVDLKGATSGAFESIKSTASSQFETMKKNVGGAAGTIKETATRRFSELRTNVGNAVGTIRATVADRFKKAKDAAGSTAKTLKDNVTRRFSEARTNVSNAMGTIRKTVSDRFGQARDAAGKAAESLRKKAAEKWESIRANTFDRFKRIREHVTGAIEALPGMFEDAVKAIGKAWDKLKEKAREPVRFVVEDILEDGLLKAIRTVADAVGLKSLSEKLHVKMPEGKAKGGILPGQSSWRNGDDQLVPMRAGEGVYVSEAMRDPYERARLHAVNAAAMRGQDLSRFREGFALGGIVGKKKEYRPVNGGPANRHTSGYGWANWAGDFPRPGGSPVYAWKDGRISDVNRWNYSYGNHIRMAHNDGSRSLYAHLSSILVSLGQRVAAGTQIGRVGTTGNSTGNHLHFEAQGASFNPASGASGTSTGDPLGWVNPFSALLAPFNAAKEAASSKLSSIKDSIFGQIVAATPGLIMNGVADKVASLIGIGDPAAGPPGSFGPGSGAVSGAAGATARRAASVLGPMFGFAGAGTYPGHDPSEARALDFMTSSKSQGDSMATYAKAHARQLGINYIIWWRKIWNIQRDAEGWRNYSGTSNPHTDHVHLSFFGKGTKYAPKGPAIVGENGPELVMFKGGEQVIPNSALTSMMSGKQSGSSGASELSAYLRDRTNQPVTHDRYSTAAAGGPIVQIGDVYVQNPWGPEYMRSKVVEVADERVTVAARTASNSR